MNKVGVDKAKRQFLTNAMTVVGAVGTGFIAVPFLAQMSPSVRAKASGAPVEYDISKLDPGQIITVEWQRKPVWILKRSPEALASLDGVENQLRDPQSNESQQPASSKNQTRSIKPEIFVTVGICTHLACSPKYRPDIAPADLGSDWKGGFFCACHGSKFDLAGRVYQGVPAPTNLVIPDYRYIDDNRIIIGEETQEASI
jgi:ubiquinol-cytochrome c reductase iron-sulfur subunit